ncbi:MAG: HD domain-containing protein [Armatimonadota bacterium]|nr:HD domain-containing protein [Armatimonadota bacterium]MDR7404590.1 HD domain-containing protein [Armatimonadota bacterium]
MPQRIPKELQVYVLLLIGAAFAFASAMGREVSPNSWPELVMFMLFIVIASMSPIPNPRGGYLTATPTLMYILLVVHPPAAALLAGGTGYSIGRAMAGGWVPWRTLSNGAQMGLSVGLASLAFRMVGGSIATPGVATLFAPLVVASLVHQAVNNLFVSFFFSRLRRTSFFDFWIRETRDFLIPNLLSVPTAAVLAILYVHVHPLSLSLYLGLLPIQRWALQLFLRQGEIHRQAIDALVAAIDAHFPQGAGHSRRVADIAAAIARRMRLSDAEVEAVELGALLHDVGMIGVDVGETRVRDPEYAVRRHVVLGADVAGELRRKDVQEIVLHHHERFDGTGYPRGLGGDRIPLGARIVAVAEAYDTLLSGGSDRRDPMSPAAAVREIQAGSGTAFDPAVVRAFMSLVDESGRVVTDRVADSG